MSYIDHVKESLQILAFDERTIIRIADDPDATEYGFLTLAIFGVASAIGSLSPLGIIFNPIFCIIGFFIGYSIYHFLAKFILGGKATGSQYFRALSNAFVLQWISVIPLLGILLSYIASLYLIVINIYILEKVHKLSKARAIILGLLPMIIMVALIVLVVIWQLGVFSSY